MLYRKLSYEYIRGLIEGEGTFTFSTYRAKKRKIPAFTLKMSARDTALIEGVANMLELDSKIYTYNHQGKDGHRRQPQAMLIVREIGNLKNTIVPFFYNQLVGNKAFQFNDWLECIGHDPWVPESYRIIYRLHKNGYYKKNPKFL